MDDGHALEPVPPGVKARPKLYELGTKGASPMFDFVQSEACLSGAWALHEVYLAMPNPDVNWVSDCQTSIFHTRLWEAYLFACFREQGCLVTQDIPSPDFHVSDNAGHVGWIEAVTANAEPFDHSNAIPVAMPNHLERQIGSAAARFARTLRSKLQRGYDTMAHVQGMPFAIAIADYHAPGSMAWSYDALPAYLYELHAVFEGKNGQQVGVMKTHTALLGNDAIPSGLFKDPANSGLAAVIFSNAGTISKFNRMGLLAGMGKEGITIERVGLLFDRTMPEGGQATIFDYDITSAEYAALWPEIGETWSIELNVFHNPLAKHPLHFDLLPDCTHWFERDGEVLCRYFYERTVLSSNTMVGGAL